MVNPTFRYKLVNMCKRNMITNIVILFLYVHIEEKYPKI